MRKLSIQKIGKILKLLLIVGGLILIPAMIGLPFFLSSNYSILYSMMIIYPNGILMLGIVYEFIRLFHSLEKNNPFTYENGIILKNTGKISFGMSILWLLDLLIMVLMIHNCYINYIIVLLFLFLLFFGVGIALQILSMLIIQATKYKEENDLTI